MTRSFLINDDRIRANAIDAVMRAEPGSVVTVSAPKRSLEQNAMFHAICTDIARSGYPWAGKKRTAAEWKVLLVSGHTKATEGEVEFVPGLEGEFVNIRESTARMSVRRATSLIEYALAWCAQHDIPLHETRRGGFLSERDAA